MPLEENQTTAGRRFAALLRQHRVARELRQEDVAERSGVSLSTINRWERGLIRNPVPIELKAVCRVVGLRPDAAWIALGGIDPEDVEDLPDPLPPASPTEEEAIAIIRDPAMPDHVIESALQYLRFLHAQAETQQPGTSKPRAAS
ncbi:MULTISPECIES: helix-turn-helix domain-containing protein [unclassified Micromonospora]|uniref:helix-turn-helix transcriptional regulator n=1 Tax=unclassified Micromonospora TaxID=2617518 RepID=UPI00331A143A